MADDDLEFIVYQKKSEVMVFQIPPASSSSGHKADEWQKCIWRGRCRIVGKGKDCSIKMIDPGNDKLFAECKIPKGDHASYVERVTDSSRYFVLKITNGDRHAFVGLGFEDRNDAFDFYCALADFKTQFVDRDLEPVDASDSLEPAKDYSMKEGQKIQIKIQGMEGKPKKSTTSQSGGYNGGSVGGFALAPPPPAGGIAPPPPAGGASRLAAAPVAAAPNFAAPAPSSSAKDDFFGDFDDFQSAPGQAAPVQPVAVAKPVVQDSSDPFFSGDSFSSFNLGAAPSSTTTSVAAPAAAAPFGFPAASPAPAPMSTGLGFSATPAAASGSSMTSSAWGSPSPASTSQPRPQASQQQQQQRPPQTSGGGFDPFSGFGGAGNVSSGTNGSMGATPLGGFTGFGSPAATAPPAQKSMQSGSAKKDPFADFDPFAM